MTATPRDVTAPRCPGCGTFYEPVVNAGGKDEKMWYCFACERGVEITPEELAIWQELLLGELRQAFTRLAPQG